MNGALSGRQVADVLLSSATTGEVRKRRRSPDRLLYWNASINATPAEPDVSAAWFVAWGPCEHHVSPNGNCIVSPRYPKLYQNMQSCKISVPPGTGPISVMSFKTEDYYDTLAVNGVDYSGSTGPEGVVPTTDIHWVTDISVRARGWEICADPPVV